MNDLFENSYKHCLQVIGNGFDLAHNMNTSWNGFHKWLVSSGHQTLAHFLESNVGLKTDLWKDFEKALGEYNIKDIYEQCTEDFEIDYDHMMRFASAIEDSPEIELMPRKEELIKCFSQWVESIWIKSEYEAVHGAVTAAAPKVFLKYFFINTKTGEKSGEVLGETSL